jgi:hypothetical protein
MCQVHNTFNTIHLPYSSETLPQKTLSEAVSAVSEHIHAVSGMCVLSHSRWLLVFVQHHDTSPHIKATMVHTPCECTWLQLAVSLRPQQPHHSAPATCAC